MIAKLLEKIAEQDEAIIKEAIFGAALRMVGKPLLRLGKGVVRRPMAAASAAMTGSELASGGQRFSNLTSANRTNPYRVPAVD